MSDSELNTTATCKEDLQVRPEDGRDVMNDISNKNPLTSGM